MIEKILPSKLSRYLIKNFLKMFLLIFLISFMIVFVINFFEFSPKMQKYSIDSLISLKIIFFRTMPIIEAIMMFILALGVNFELIRICDKSELTIIYMSNYSPWRVLKTILITAATIGILNITLFNRLSIKLYNISEELFLESIDESAEVKYLESKYGIWLNLKLSDEEDLIIKSNRLLVDLVSKKIKVSTNDTSDIQRVRLKKVGLLPYIQEVYGGEYYFKPHEEAYIRACGSYVPSECMMVGDDFQKDVIGPRSLGISAWHYDPNGRNPEYEYSIKSLRKVKEMF